MNMPRIFAAKSRAADTLLLALFASIFLIRSARADSTVVFNEIMYHPATNEARLEWIELYNQMAVNMDISSWSLDGGVQFQFPEGTVIPGGGYLVIASSPADLTAATGYTNVLGPLSGRLSNSGERLELRNNNQRLMDWVDYGTDGDWPVSPDGGGVSLAKAAPNSASAPTANWRPSAEIGGTPGAANFPANESSAVTTVLVPLTALWTYINPATNLPAAWKEPGFAAKDWNQSKAGFYAGDSSAPGGDIVPIPTLF
jgi:hypothetical protein